MPKTIQEIYLELKAKMRKNDNGVIYEIVPPSRESEKEEKDIAFQNRIRGIRNLPSVSNMNVKPLPLPLQSTLSSSLIQESSHKAEKKYCPYCCTIADYEKDFCPNCGLPLPEKYYRNEINESGTRIGFDIENIIYNIENEIEPPAPVSIETSQGNNLLIKPIMTNKAFVRYYPSYENRISNFCTLKKYTVIDFETANMYPDSVCQMGIVVIEDNKVVEEKKYMIRPPYNDFRNSSIHGITLDDVREEKTFLELWVEIKPYIERKLIGAYNAQFDIGCLLATLDNFEIEMPDFAYFDILQNVKEKYEGFGSYKLKTVARRLKIKYKAHDALSDAQAAAEVQMKCDMTTVFSFMYAKDNKHFEVMTELFTNKDILSFIRKKIKEMQSIDFTDYKKIYDILNFVKEDIDNKAKAIKLRGEIFEKCGMMREALNSYKKAYSLDNKIGVKGKIQKIEKEMVKMK